MKKVVKQYQMGKMDEDKLRRTLASYFGWCKYCDSKHLLNTIEQQIKIHFSNGRGREVNITRTCGLPIYFTGYVQYSKYGKVNFVFNHRPYTTKTVSRQLIATLDRPKYFIIKSYGRKKKNKLQDSSEDVRTTRGRIILL